MKRSRSSHSFPVSRAHTSAFTLIELMVVIGIMTFLAVGIGLSLSDSGGNSLASAQNSLAALAGQARAQAAVNQTEARLLIYGTRPPSGDAEKYLRMLRVVVAETAGSTTRWLAVGSPVYLPRGVYVVPPTTTGLVATGVTWPTNPAPISTLSPATAHTVVNDPAGADSYFWIEYKPDGTLNTTLGSQAYAKLAVASGTVANNLPSFTNAAAVRGLLLRPTGAIAFVNDAASF